MEPQELEFLADFLKGGVGPIVLLAYVAWKLDRQIARMEQWIKDHDAREKQKKDA
ncbi:MAG: hypothetical protein ACPGO3_13325 [Magnetospiraceae bacterium]